MTGSIGGDSGGSSAEPSIHTPGGVVIGVGRSNSRYKGRDDVMLLYFAAGASIAGVFTRNSLPAAPVVHARAIVAGGRCGAIVANAGNANAFTGAAGERSVRSICGHVAELTGVAAERVVSASTGVIGEPMEDMAIHHAVSEAWQNRGASWHQAAAAICTTDTFPKVASRCFGDGRDSWAVTGICKGSGMIAPDMTGATSATMLAFLVTDAPIAAADLQRLLEQQVEGTLNAVTVDGDTSTNDCCLLVATGTDAVLSGVALESFADALHGVLEDLTIMLARDGEGARKLICVSVHGAASHADAMVLAKAVANSPLVKTAIAGEDANWGRVVMALGKPGIVLDADQIRIDIGGIGVTAAGARVEGFDEAAVTRHLKTDRVELSISVGAGSGAARAWGCDLTHAYIDINADYRS